MFLKKIEMQGFKSFADKTKIEFEKGVTAVVGPNGSGKSNITESLRWALGESSAKSLRGGKMPDIIFAGTESRNALNFAEVAIVLDNSDAFIKDAGKEIRVERHIYRNGDSDYLIDGKKVRLRDIHDLFMDTGLGRDSFSIISQGRVEEIFNSKPEERRTIFEEAAGVLKYKTRKKETQSKLTQTQDNLDRLDDIIYELETQVGPLEKQAKVAREYNRLEDERKELHLSILVEDVKADKKRLAETEESLAKVLEDLKAYHQQREALEVENQKLKAKRQELIRESESKQSELLELTKAEAELKSQIDLIKLETSQKNEKKAETSTQIANLEAELETLMHSIDEKKSALNTIESRKEENTQSLKEILEDLQRFSGDPDHLLEKLRTDYLALMQDEARVSNQLTLLKSELAKEDLAKERQAQTLIQQAKQVKEFKQSYEELANSYQETSNHLQELLQDYQEKAKSIQGLKEAYQMAQTKLFDYLDQKKAKEARLNSLEAIQKNHSQFYAGVRAVLQASNQLQGILGAVSEHLSFDTQYQTALEIALGASSQNIIVKDEAAAKAAIAYLKKNRQGRATFLPLTTIKARYLADTQLSQLQKSEGFLGTAESLVTYNEELAHIFKNLLNMTVIFDTIDNANKAAKALHYKVRIVTLDGTELRPGGSFAGGANRQNNTTFIKPEMDNIQASLEDLHQEIRNKEKEVAAQKNAVESAEEYLTKLKAEGEACRLQEQELSFKVTQLQEKLEDAQAILDNLQNLQKQDSQRNFTEEIAELEAKLQALNVRKTDLNQEMETIKTDKDSINRKKASLTEALAQARLAERDIANEKRFEESHLHRLQADKDQKEENLNQLQTFLNSHISEEDITRLPALETHLGEIAERKSSVEQHLVRLRFENDDYQAQLEELEEKLLREQSKNEDFIRKQTKAEADLEQVTGRLRNHAKTLTEEFQMSFEEAETKTQVIEDITLSKQELQKIQRQIRALGPINSDAIAQFEEVSERLQFLNGQKADLNKAKNMLLETIAQMDSEVKARFKVTFEAIRTSFQETFKQMFGGGSADLILTDGDLLTSGIEISVQPPGKKIQSLNLMSGGEKALSALALLFAIIRVKTIPFVILDEVEAALDEANVKRFGDYLNRFDKDSQFIVVTHRKGTMAAADSIYGITMQESGISKVVSVKLKDSENLSFLN
ncbi:chromosome segregation protein SMC [Streptococcus penaeicida]|uniref:Chromosome partition protein Smc n=1 Tax=Streptococcus penaeicida TaxID=1765960 RepID=A0A2N8LDQ8_9STRE|nr:chromosome segregation protein SMC [Streptococcus penaeicida]PND48291.1 chromosome segregation protein SMC [Streptococcus penaeicida]